MSLFIALVLMVWPAEDAVLKSLPFPKIQKKKIRVYLDASEPVELLPKPSRRCRNEVANSSYLECGSTNLR